MYAGGWRPASSKAWTPFKVAPRCWPNAFQRLLAASFIFVHAEGVLVPALGGKVMARLGTSPMQLPGGAIYQTLEKGTLMPSSGLGSMMIEKLRFL